MAEKKHSAAPETSGVKKTLNQAGELARLKLEHRRTVARRKEAYARLGELIYNQRHPRKGSKPADLDTAVNAAVAEITRLSEALVDLSVRMEILKADMKH